MFPPFTRRHARACAQACVEAGRGRARWPLAIAPALARLAASPCGQVEVRVPKRAAKSGGVGRGSLRPMRPLSPVSPLIISRPQPRHLLPQSPGGSLKARAPAFGLPSAPVRPAPSRSFLARHSGFARRCAAGSAFLSAVAVCYATSPVVGDCRFISAPLWSCGLYPPL